MDVQIHNRLSFALINVFVEPLAAGKPKFAVTSFLSFKYLSPQNVIQPYYFLTSLRKKGGIYFPLSFVGTN